MNLVTYPRDIRFRWYLQVEKHHRPVKEVAAIFGISRPTTSGTTMTMAEDRRYIEAGNASQT